MTKKERVLDAKESKGAARAARTLKKRPKMADVPPEELCDYCNGKCCRYIALPIDKPTNYEEFDYVRWYLYHEGTSIFVEDGDWYLIVFTPCRNLDEKNRCRVYPIRPQICRDYSVAKCEYDDHYLFDQYFETAEQIEEYAQALLGPRPGQTIRTPRPETFVSLEMLK